MSELVVALEYCTSKQSWIELYHTHCRECSNVMLKVVSMAEMNTFDKD